MCYHMCATVCRKLRVSSTKSSCILASFHRGENSYMADRVGQQLGNYRLLRKIGQGAFAEVYLGEHQYLEIPAAIKVLHQYLSTGAWIAAAGGVQSQCRLSGTNRPR